MVGGSSGKRVRVFFCWLSPPPSDHAFEMCGEFFNDKPKIAYAMGSRLEGKGIGEGKTKKKVLTVFDG